MRLRRRGAGAGIMIDLEMKRQGLTNRSLAKKIGHSATAVRYARRMDYAQQDGPEISASMLLDIALGLSLDPQELIILAYVPMEYRSAPNAQPVGTLGSTSRRMIELFEQLPSDIQEAFIDSMISSSQRIIDV